MGAEGEEEAKKRNNPIIIISSKPSLSQSQFLSWKQQKDADRLAKEEEAARKRAEDIASGVVQMNGRELFLHEPEVFDNSRY